MLNAIGMEVPAAQETILLRDGTPIAPFVNVLIPMVPVLLTAQWVPQLKDAVKFILVLQILERVFFN